MKTLTLNVAKTLKGKRIRYSAEGYDRTYSGELTAGEIVSEWDYYKTQPCPGYPSRTAEWETWMRPERIREAKNKLILLDEEGNNKHYIYCYLNSRFFNEDTFTLSDADREVFYEEIEEE